MHLCPLHCVGNVGWKLKCAQTTCVIFPAKINTFKVLRVIVPGFAQEGNTQQTAKHHHGC